jgi:hypothetical protein
LPLCPLKRLTAHAAAHASSTVRELLTARLLETGEMVPTPVPVQEASRTYISCKIGVVLALYYLQ